MQLIYIYIDIDILKATSTKLKYPKIHLLHLKNLKLEALYFCVSIGGALQQGHQTVRMCDPTHLFRHHKSANHSPPLPRVAK